MSTTPELSAVPSDVFEWLDEQATASQLVTLASFIVRRLASLGPDADWARPLLARLVVPSDVTAIDDDVLERLQVALQGGHDRVGGEIVRRLGVGR